ncbi:MAG: gephyrin-like molybdotransferase Glp [Thermodesulfobacteriota bacterium]
MKEFFKVKTSDEVFAIINEFPVGPTEEISLPEGAGRILAEPVISPEDMPPFSRSTMDGYAVRARDTFGSSESMPALLTIAGSVDMGASPSRALSGGQAYRILTGGMLPPGGDAVVMQEYTQQADETTIEVMKTVAPGEHVILRGEDLKKGEEILSRGHRLRPQDIGALAAIGRQKIIVHQKPRVAIISTGDEIVPIQEMPPPGKIRDINAYTLWAAVFENGGIPGYLGIVPDKFDALRAKCIEGIEQADIILVSGGSSVGSRDFTVAVFESFPESRILLHGVSVSPGKPTILARIGKKALWGLPGHPASSMIIFWLFVRPLLQRIGGLEPQTIAHSQLIKARLSRNVPSAQGREDYVRVRILPDEKHAPFKSPHPPFKKGGAHHIPPLGKGDTGGFSDETGYVAEPVFGKSGLISTMTKAHGLIRVDMNTEGLDKDSIVDVYLF